MSVSSASTRTPPKLTTPTRDGKWPLSVASLVSIPVNAAVWGIALLPAVLLTSLVSSTFTAVQGTASVLQDTLESLPGSLPCAADLALLARRHPVEVSLSGLALVCGAWTVRGLVLRGLRVAVKLLRRACRLCAAVARRVAAAGLHRARLPLALLVCIWGFAAHSPLVKAAARVVPGLVAVVRPAYFATAVLNDAVRAVTYVWPQRLLEELQEFARDASALTQTLPGGAAPPTLLLLLLALGGLQILRRLLPVASPLAALALRPLRALLSAARVPVHAGPLAVTALLAGDQMLGWGLAALEASALVLLPTSRAGALGAAAAALAAARLARRLRTPLDGKQAAGAGPVADDVTRLNATPVDRVWYPRSEADVAHIVRLARARGRHVSCRGQRHTMGGHTIAAGGYVVDLGNLDGVSYDAEAGTVTCGPGATWGHLIRYLNRFGMSPRTMQSYCSFSVGGTIAVNAHGITTDHAMHESVVSMRVVDAAGQAAVVSRDRDPELFGRVVGGFGLFGIVTELTLKADANHKLTMEMIKLSAAEFPAVYRECLADRSIDVKLARVDITNSKDLYLFVFRRASEKPTVSHLEAAPREMSTVTRLLYKWIMPLRFFQRVRYLVEDYTQQPVDWSGEADRNTLMHESAVPLAQLSNIIIDVDDTFVLQEYFVPDDRSPDGGNLQAWLSDSRPVLWAAHEHVTLLNITIRYVRADACTALPYARRDSYAFVLYYRVHRTAAGDAELAALHHRLVALTLALGGTFYLPYRHHYTDEELEQAYPAVGKFFADKQRRDPHNVFSNAWYQRYGARHVDVRRRPAGPLPPAGEDDGGATTRAPPARGGLASPKRGSEGAGGEGSSEGAGGEVALPRVDNWRRGSYAAVFADPVAREKLRLFMEHQFRVEDPAALYSFVARAVWSPRNADDLAVYRDLKARLEGRPLRGLLAARNAYRQLAQLQQQTNEVMEQLAGLLGDLQPSQRRVINDVMTIGDPGRLVRPLRRLLGLKGRVWVVHDRERGPRDWVERGSVAPVGRFVPIDYDDVAELPVPDACVDLVTLSMGLHHFPQPQLARVLRTVRRVLRPGGLFVVREHDGRPEVLPIADLAHSLFNAVTGVSPEEEAREVRAFRPVLEWRRVLELAGFEDSYVYRVLPLHRDPTEDVMMAFVKPRAPPAVGEPEAEGAESGAEVRGVARGPAAPGDEARVQRICRAAQDSLVSAGTKPFRPRPDSTYFRLPEWLLVTVAQEFGKYMDHTPWFFFPFAQFVALYWGVLEQELRIVAQEAGLWAALWNPGTLMGVVIGAVISLMFAQLQLLAVLVLLVMGDEKDVSEEHLVLEGGADVDWAAVDSRIRAIRVSPCSEASPAWLLKAPKHAQFTPVMLKLAVLAAKTPSLRLLQISGCAGFIQLHVVACSDAAVRSVTAIEHLDYLFEYQLPPTASPLEVAETGRRAVHLAARVRIPHLLGVIGIIQEKVADAYVDQVYDMYEG